jgi:hypothetical protein
MTQSNIIQKNNEICPLANLKDQLQNLIPVTQLRNNHFKSILTKITKMVIPTTSQLNAWHAQLHYGNPTMQQRTT